MDCPNCVTREKLVEYPGWMDGKRVVKYECPVCKYTKYKEEDDETGNKVKVRY